MQYNPSFQSDIPGPPSILLTPCSAQARHAVVHADFSSLMPLTDHTALTLAISDPLTQFPSSTIPAAHSILARQFHPSAPYVALFTGGNNVALPATLTQLSGHTPSSLYSFTDIISLINCSCFVTHQHILHKLQSPNLNSLTLALNSALHSFLQNTLQLAKAHTQVILPPLMPCPDHHLLDNHTFVSNTLLVSNLFTGQANKPLQLSDLLKLAKNLSIELDIADLMNKFDAGEPSSPEYLPFHGAHAILLQLRSPITVADHYDPSLRTFPPDWYITDPTDDTPTEYFIQPIESPPAEHLPMSPLLTISGVPQAGAYQTRLRFAALRLIKAQLPWKLRHALIACYHHIRRPNLPAEPVLVIYLPSRFHSPLQRSDLQQALMDKTGHGSPATLSLPFRNATMDFFEVVLSASSCTAVIPNYNLLRQQESGFYYYYNGLLPSVPFERLMESIAKNLPTNADIMGAAIIERHFDSLCRCSPTQP